MESTIDQASTSPVVQQNESVKRKHEEEVVDNKKFRGDEESGSDSGSDADFDFDSDGNSYYSEEDTSRTFVGAYEEPKASEKLVDKSDTAEENGAESTNVEANTTEPNAIGVNASEANASEVNVVEDNNADTSEADNSETNDTKKVISNISEADSPKIQLLIMLSQLFNKLYNKDNANIILYNWLHFLDNYYEHLSFKNIIKINQQPIIDKLEHDDGESSQVMAAISKEGESKVELVEGNTVTVKVKHEGNSATIVPLVLKSYNDCRFICIPSGESCENYTLSIVDNTQLFTFENPLKTTGWSSYDVYELPLEVEDCKQYLCYTRKRNLVMGNKTEIYISDTPVVDEHLRCIPLAPLVSISLDHDETIDEGSIMSKNMLTAWMHVAGNNYKCYKKILKSYEILNDEDRVVKVDKKGINHSVNFENHYKFLNLDVYKSKIIKMGL